MADRHRPGYYKEYNAKRKAAGKSTDRHRKHYYRDYNKAHPERLNRGFTKGYIDGCVNNGPIERELSYDPFLDPQSFSELIDAHEAIWHDDDWCEDVDQ